MVRDLPAKASRHFHPSMTGRWMAEMGTQIILISLVYLPRIKWWCSYDFFSSTLCTLPGRVQISPGLLHIYASGDWVVLGPWMIWYWAEGQGSSKGSPGYAQGWVLTVIRESGNPLLPAGNRESVHEKFWDFKILRNFKFQNFEKGKLMGTGGLCGGSCKVGRKFLHGKTPLPPISVQSKVQHEQARHCHVPPLAVQSPLLLIQFIPSGTDGAGFGSLSLDVCPICGLASSEP